MLTILIPTSFPTLMVLVGILLNQRASDRLDARISGLEGRFNGFDGRFANLEAKFAGMEGRFAGMEGRFAGLEGRLTGMEGKFAGLDGRFANLEGRIDRMRDQHHSDMMMILGRDNDLNSRIAKLEEKREQ